MLSTELADTAGERRVDADTLLVKVAFDQPADGPMDVLLAKLLGSGVTWLVLQSEPSSDTVVRVVGTRDAVQKAWSAVDRFNDGKAFDALYCVNLP